MTKHDRAKMEERLKEQLNPLFQWQGPRAISAFVAREVTRAVRAERKAWQDAEELRLASMTKGTKR